MKKQWSIFVMLLFSMVLLGGLGQAQEDVQEISVIHSLTVGDGAPTMFPSVITVKVNQPVRLFNISADVAHAPIFISSDENGSSPVFGIDGFTALTGEVSVVEFTPDQTGEFFITHLAHGHPIVGKLVVAE